MAHPVRLIHKDSGIIKQGYYGFSWTTLFFGSFPALFRCDFLTFVGSIIVYLIIALATAGIGNLVAGLIWAFFYNGYYTRRMLERGYRLDDRADIMATAYAKLKILPARQPMPAIPA